MNEVHVTGLADLQKFLDQLPAKLERNVLRGALRAGATQELLPEVQANLMSAGAVKTGELIAGLKVKTSASGGKVTASVVSTGRHNYIMKWIEFGVKAHNIAAKAGGWLAFGGIFARVVHHPGFAARPCMRPALDRSGGAAVVAAAEYMKARLERGGLNTADIVIGEVP
jgi:hypothetical protein